MIAFIKSGIKIIKINMYGIIEPIIGFLLLGPNNVLIFFGVSFVVRGYN